MIVSADARSGEVIWRPSQEEAALSNVACFTEWLQGRGITASDYHELWTWSVEDPADFWSLFTEFMGVDLGGAPGPATDGRPMPGTAWFPGRTVNFAQHLLEGKNGTALIALAEDGRREEISWDRFRQLVASVAASLRGMGIRPGDRVAAVLPNVLEAVAAFLACASVGAVWTVCSPEFGTGAIASRFGQLDPRVLIAVPGYRLGGRDRDRAADIATVVDQLPTLERVVWVDRHTSAVPPTLSIPTDKWEDLAATPGEPQYSTLPFDHPLWVLFSSGTTGVPKGIVHGHGGALLEQLKMLSIHSDLRPGDRFLSVASTSWVVWNGLVSALGCGATAVLLDGNPTHPDLEHLWQLTARERVTVLGTGAGYIHACLKAGLVPRRDFDLTALRAVHVTGSPLSEDGFRWVYRSVGDVWLASMSGGTDIASVFVGGVPTLPVRVGRLQAPALGVNVQAWDEAGSRLTGAKGELVVVDPMPSMPLFFWNDPDGCRYREAYFDTYPGVWRHGDFIEIGSDGSSVIHGRSDSTLNRNGIRLGSADLYRIVEQLPEVLEALVVGAELGSDYYMPLFVVLTDGTNADDAAARIREAIRRDLSPRYIPDAIIPVPGIPHTRTGKKLEVPVKRIIQGAEPSSVADLGAVDDAELLQQYARYAPAHAAPTTARHHERHQP